MVKSGLAENALVVTGAQGRIGRLLRHLWADRPVLWLGRAEWDMGASAAPALPPGATILHLAGTTAGDLGQNLKAARALAGTVQPGQRVVLISSIAVYGPGERPFHEDDPLALAGDYARAKLAVEAELAPLAPMILRLGNLFGADALTRTLRDGPVELDRTADGRGPLRSWIGPLTFGRVLAALVADPRPGVWNLAQPPALAMADLVAALGGSARFGPRPAPVPRAEMALDRLARIVDLPPATPQGLAQELYELEGRWP